MPSFLRRLVWIVLVLSCSVAQAAEDAPVDYARDIQPLLEKHCYECHDGRKQTAALRLDVRSRAAKGGESGDAAIVAGASAKSTLIARVRGDVPDLIMPPEGDRLSAEQVALLVRWIDAGATWPDQLAGEDKLKKEHWAFRAPKRPALPNIKDKEWNRNPIDRFVRARLDSEGITHSPPADRETLIRRLYLDLTGLPPSPKDVDRFVRDEDRGHVGRAVDRLLDSPHYGERWARWWLDAARYADSDGYEKDKSRQVWFYRDWVISAINRDLPYDQFVIEQIAGDQLPSPTQEQLVATGFLRNSMLNEEGGIDPEQFRMEAMFDRMDAIGKGVLGVTIQCAQCHDHKFDPLSQEDYYRVFAFLNDAHEANIAVYTPAEQLRRAELLRKIAEIEGGIKERFPDWQAQMAAWEAKVQNDQPEWAVVKLLDDEDTEGGQKYRRVGDGSLVAQGYAPTKHSPKMTVRTDLRPITGFRLELLTDPNLPLNGPGRSIYGTAALTEFGVEATPLAAPAEVAATEGATAANPAAPAKPDLATRATVGAAQPIKIASATSDVNPPETPLPAIYDDRSNRRRVIGPIAFAIDGNNDTAWGTDVGPALRNQPRKAVFVPDKPIDNAGGTVLTFVLSQNHGGWNSDDNQNHNLGRFRVSITSAPNPTADSLPARVREVLAIPAAQRTQRQIATLFSYWRTTVPDCQEANAKIDELWRKHPEGSSQLVLLERETPRETNLLKRGDFLKPDHKVQPGVPSFLHPLPENAPPTRLTFARWLVDPHSPTTARSIVNRVWQSYFGTGLVSTSEDLGTQSEAPSHPELLDWLAVEFMEDGWSLKRLHKLIVTSQTYRQSSHVTPEQTARDPYNRLLGRGSRLRVDAEAVRDVALAASGLLDRRIGGASVFPPLPEFMIQPPVSY
ncbi:MAG TPA: PSD1 and planctomycete cytochrome C domain-containing protein, partial [Pirellulales bacterium]